MFARRLDRQLHPSTLPSFLEVVRVRILLSVHHPERYAMLVTQDYEFNLGSSFARKSQTVRRL